MAKGKKLVLKRLVLVLMNYTEMHAYNYCSVPWLSLDMYLGI